MSDVNAEIARAEAEATAARARIAETVAVLRAKLSPERLARHAWDDARERGEAAARGALDAARAHPLRTAAAAGVVAALLARRPLARLIGRLFSRDHATRDASKG